MSLFKKPQPSASANASNLTDDQTKAAAKAYGQKLGFLIAGLDVSDEVKQSLAVLIPHMTPEQMDKLMNELEFGYLNAATQDMDDKLKADLTKIQAGYTAQTAQADAKAMKEMDEMEEEIDQMQGSK